MNFLPKYSLLFALKFTPLALGMLQFINAQRVIEPNTVIIQEGIFEVQRPLSMKMQFSIREVKKNTNDSIYLNSLLHYQRATEWDSIPIKIRARGNFRKQECYYPPLKIKIKKSDAKKTIFAANRKLKMVLPCLLGGPNDDNIIKEYMAYKLYEVISPYHFKTRLADIEFDELRGLRSKKHQLKAILLEDVDDLSKRLDAKRLKRKMHPLQQDTLCSIRNAYFQYMIGNTDFSVRSQHNNKQYFVDQKILYIPYDFDMCGLVNASYATVSGTQNLVDNITMVTQRAYKGYQRDIASMQQVRNEFLEHKPKLLLTMEALKLQFEDPRQFHESKEYIMGFFEIIEDDKKFEKHIFQKGRTL
ncbi:MAG: hypothetical protein HKP38_08545 [Croceitalea sp.]|nr:hypothetical protein [Croceitalea sp.]MBT8238618.1 hypothetical protein [Croceitalea sp.]NNC34525.1 hypothetical protein [Croceitalea sp.]NNL09256.1 hypothetical protein [Croceitalea sp.]NNM19039.1 hypothetical protein [Croceitalea sp.]